MPVITDPFVASDLAAVISETWTTIVNEKTFDETVLANFITDLSSFASAGSDIFKTFWVRNGRCINLANCWNTLRTSYTRPYGQ